MEYDKEVTTITDILKALDKFDNKEEIIEAIKPSLYDIETDWHMEQCLREQNLELICILDKQRSRK